MDAPVPTCWTLVVTPEKEEPVDMPEDCCLRVTNACLVDEEGTEPVRLFAKVETMLPDEENPANIKTIDSDTMIAFFLPGSKVHENVNVLFSPINVVAFRVVGKGKVHLAGVIEPIDIDDSDELIFEEEEEEEEAKEEEKKEEEKKE